MKHLLLTRDRPLSKELEKRLYHAELKTTHFPTIEIVPLELQPHQKEYIRKIHTFDVVILTSQNASLQLFSTLRRYNISLPSHLTFICMGKTTAQGLKKHNNVLIANASHSEEFISFLKTLDLSEKKILFPHSLISGNSVNSFFEYAKYHWVDLPLYTSQKSKEKITQKARFFLQKNPYDIAVFTSPSSFRFFLEKLHIKRASFSKQPFSIVSIGATTSSEIKSNGFDVHLQASKPNFLLLIDELIKTYGAKQ